MEADNPPRKKIKREVLADGSDFFDFFSSLNQHSMAPFRINIKQFLSLHANQVLKSDLTGVAYRRRGWCGMKMWYKHFRVSKPDGATSIVTLEVVEEDLASMPKLQEKKIYCHHCSYAGREEIIFLNFCPFVLTL
jgi:hypothetical protein